MSESIICENCGEEMIKIDHYEYDGVTENGSYEPYWECPNNCDEVESN